MDFKDPIAMPSAPSNSSASVDKRNKGFLAGTLIGTLGGLIGLGGAEFRLPVLVGWFRLPTLEAIILNKAMSLVVVAAALLFRARSIPFEQLYSHIGIALNLLAGSLLGAWWAAGHAMTMPRVWLNRVILVLLCGLSLVMLTEAWFGVHQASAPLFADPSTRMVAGVAAGLLIGVVAAVLGVAGGELLIPTIVLLFGADIKLAGSLSLAVSLPTMIVGFSRYARSNSFAVLKQERTLFKSMAVGSILGAGIGGLLLGIVPTQWLLLLLGLILLISAVKTFSHR